MIDGYTPPLIFPTPGIIRPATADLYRPPSIMERVQENALIRLAMVPGTVPIIAPSVARITHTDDEFQTPNQTTYTFTGKSLGPAASDRVVLVGTVGRGGVARLLSTMTIGGVSATPLVNQNAAGNLSSVALAIASVPSGSTGDVVVTWNGGVNRCGIVVWRISGLLSLAARDSLSDTTDPLGGNLNVLAGGVVAGIIYSAGSPTASSWTGLNKDVEYLAAATEADGNMAGGSIASPLAQTLAASGDWGGSPTAPIGAFVSLR